MSNMASTANTAFDLILFDLDGTLADTAPEITDAVNDTLSEISNAKWERIEEAQIRLWIGHGTRTLFLDALKHVGVVVDESADARTNTIALGADLDSFYARFLHHYGLRVGTRSTLYPQVRETLLALRQGGIKVGLLTNKETIFSQLLLRAHSLTEYFDTLIFGDTLPFKKPDGRTISTAMDTFAIRAERTLMVGDSSIDCATARAAGVTVYLLPYGYNMGQSVHDCQPDRVIESLAALL